MGIRPHTAARRTALIVMVVAIVTVLLSLNAWSADGFSFHSRKPRGGNAGWGGLLLRHGSPAQNHTFKWLYSAAVPAKLVCNQTQLEALWNQSCVPMLTLPDDVQPIAAFTGVTPRSGEVSARFRRQFMRSVHSKQERVRIHWVIKSCPRISINRYLLSSIVSGVFNDLDAATISIVWCRPPGGTLPFMLYNLRRSRSINIFHVPEKLSKWKHLGSTLTALQVPEALGSPELPLMITEDDVLFASDANGQLAAALTKIKDWIGTNGNPFAMNFYAGTLPGTVNVSASSKDSDYQQHPPEDILPERFRNGTEAPHNITLVPGGLWGTQCQVYSGGMTKMLTQHLYMNYRAREEGLEATNEYHTYLPEDIAIMYGLEHRMGCNKLDYPCHAFIAQPSLVQHFGTFSTHFSNGAKHGNSRFHVADRFPMHVRFPTLENDTDWAK